MTPVNKHYALCAIQRKHFYNKWIIRFSNCLNLIQFNCLQKYLTAVIFRNPPLQGLLKHETQKKKKKLKHDDLKVKLKGSLRLII